jgi:hypothetical protein
MMLAVFQLWVILIAFGAIWTIAFCIVVYADWSRPVEILLAISILSASAVAVAFFVLSVIHPGLLNGGI